MSFQSSVARRPFFAIASSLISGVPVQMCETQATILDRVKDAYDNRTPYGPGHVVQRKKITVKNLLAGIANKNPVGRRRVLNNTKYCSETDAKARERALRLMKAHTVKASSQGLNSALRARIINKISKARDFDQKSIVDELITVVSCDATTADLVVDLSEKNYNKKVAHKVVIRGLLHIIMRGMAAPEDRIFDLEENEFPTDVLNYIKTQSNDTPTIDFSSLKVHDTVVALHRLFHDGKLNVKKAAVATNQSLMRFFLTNLRDSLTSNHYRPGGKPSDGSADQIMSEITEKMKMMIPETKAGTEHATDLVASLENLRIEKDNAGKFISDLGVWIVKDSTRAQLEEELKPHGTQITDEIDKLLKYQGYTSTADQIKEVKEIAAKLRTMIKESCERQKSLGRILDACLEYVEHFNSPVEYDSKSKDFVAYSDFENFSREDLSALKKTNNGCNVADVAVMKRDVNSDMVNLKLKLDGVQEREIPIWFLSKRLVDAGAEPNYNEIARELSHGVENTVTPEQVKEVADELMTQNYQTNLGERVAAFQLTWACLTQHMISLGKAKDKNALSHSASLEAIEPLWAALNIEKIHAFKHFVNGLSSTLSKKIVGRADESTNNSSEPGEKVDFLDKIIEAFKETAMQISSVEAQIEDPHHEEAMRFAKLACEAQYMLGVGPDTFNGKTMKNMDKFQSLWKYASSTATSKTGNYAADQSWDHTDVTGAAISGTPADTLCLVLPDKMENLHQVRGAKYCSGRENGTHARKLLENDLYNMVEGPKESEDSKNHSFFLPFETTKETLEPYVVKIKDPVGTNTSANVIVQTGPDKNSVISLPVDRLRVATEPLSNDIVYEKGFVYEMIDKQLVEGKGIDDVKNLANEIFTRVYDEAWRRYGLFLEEKYTNMQAPSGLDSLQFSALVACACSETLVNIRERFQSSANAHETDKLWITEANTALSSVVRNSTKLHADFGEKLMTELCNLSHPDQIELKHQLFTNVAIKRFDEEPLNPAISTHTKYEPSGTTVARAEA